MNISNYISSGIIEMYVMGICSDEEKNEIQLLRLRYPLLDMAIQEYEKELEIKMQQSTTLPSAATDEKILHTIDTLQYPDSAVSPLISNTSVRYMWLKPVAAAAVVLLVISSYFNYSLYKKHIAREDALETINNNENNNTLPAADYAILKNPSITPVAMYGVAPHTTCRCTMFWDKKTGKMYIMIHHLIPSSASKDYQLWATVNNSLVSVGIINDEIRGRFIEMGNVPPGATAFTVTLEKAGGNNVPALDEIYLAGKI